jgi:DNA-binding MarR family transcriptional regulator
VLSKGPFRSETTTSQVLSPQVSNAVLEAWASLLRAHASATRAVSVQLQADHGLTINDYEALLHLSQAEDGAMRRVDLAGDLLLTPSGVTRLLDGLERAGYVEKGVCRSDARVTYAVITEAGREKLKEASCSHLAAVSELFQERFSDSELAVLGSLLGRLPGDAEDGAECCAPGS